MAKKCRKIKYSTRKQAEKAAKFMSHEYGSQMVAYRCDKCAERPYHIANASVPKVLKRLLKI